MLALHCGNDTLELRETDRPRRGPGEILLRVTAAGICSTDIEIKRGYIEDFNGIPGHEFIGTIEEADDPSIIGLRATASINCGCGGCAACARGMERHCPDRTVLGIVKRDGCFAEYITVPKRNVVLLPDDLPDSSSLLIEPLAAALEILEQVSPSDGDTILLIGDGRLAQLIGCVFLAKGYELTVSGRHPEKLGHLERRGARVASSEMRVRPLFDLVIEASGSAAGFEHALSYVKPRGCVVVKSTFAGAFPFNPSSIVVNEITLIGSRCGRFEEAIRFLENYRPDLSYLITARFPLRKAIEAFETVEKDRNQLKVVLEMQSSDELPQHSQPPVE